MVPLAQRVVHDVAQLRVPVGDVEGAAQQCASGVQSEDVVAGAGRDPEGGFRSVGGRGGGFQRPLPQVLTVDRVPELQAAAGIGGEGVGQGSGVTAEDDVLRSRRLDDGGEDDLARTDVEERDPAVGVRRGQSLAPMADGRFRDPEG